MERSALISTRREIEGIDTFRGLAAMLVFLYHFWSFIWYEKSVVVGGLNLSPFFQAGYRGVDIFFVLSGFLLFTSLWHSKAGLKEYYLRRMKRIVPIYYFSLFVLLILQSPTFFTTREGLLDIGKHLLFLHAFFPESFQSINPVAWTLSHEMIFYAILPLLFWLGGRRWWRIMFVGLAMIGASWAYRNYLFNHLYIGWDEKQQFFFTEQVIGKLDEFGIGIIAGFFFMKTMGKNLHWIGRFITLGIFLAASASFYYLLGMSARLGSGIRHIEWMQMSFGTLTATAFAVGLLAFLHTFRFLKSTIGNRFFGFIGLISYSIYLWHYTILEKIAPLEIAVIPKFFLGLSLTLILSATTYFFIELPFLKRRTVAPPEIHLPQMLERERSLRRGVSRLKTPSRSKLPVSGKYL